MRRLLLILIALFLTITPAVALQSTSNDGWPVEQHCINVQSQPPDGWTLGGKIFFLGNYGRVREMQSNLDTVDFIPHDENSFTFAASVSPDGKWLAVPTGDVEPISDIDDAYTFSEINIYDTQSGENAYQIPWDVNWVFIPHYSTDLVPPLYWVDNTHILYATGNSTSRLGYSIVNPFTKQIQKLKTNDDYNAWYDAMSPDSTRIFTGGYGAKAFSLLDFSSNENIGFVTGAGSVIWKRDSSQFAAQTRIDNETSLALYDREGAEIAEIIKDGYLEAEQNLWSPDGRYLIFRHQNPDGIYLADTEQKKVIDLCLDESFPNRPVWASNSRTFATVTMVGYKSILTNVSFV
jgi:hypothetical protein